VKNLGLVPGRDQMPGLVASAVIAPLARVAGIQEDARADGLVVGEQA
jgi:hypothetical protein